MKRRDFLKGALLAPIVVPAVLAKSDIEPVSVKLNGQFFATQNNGMVEMTGNVWNIDNWDSFDFDNKARQFGESAAKTFNQIIADVLSGKNS